MPTSRQQTEQDESTGSQGGFCGSGLEGMYSLPVTIHRSKFSSGYTYCRDAGGCFLAVCTGGKENSFGK